MNSDEIAFFPKGYANSPELYNFLSYIDFYIIIGKAEPIEL